MSAGGLWETVNLETRLRYWMDEYEYSVLRANYWRVRAEQQGIIKHVLSDRKSIEAFRYFRQYNDRQGFAFREIMYIWDLMGMTNYLLTVKAAKSK